MSAPRPASADKDASAPMPQVLSRASPPAGTRPGDARADAAVSSRGERLQQQAAGAGKSTSGKTQCSTAAPVPRPGSGASSCASSTHTAAIGSSCVVPAPDAVSNTGAGPSLLDELSAAVAAAQPADARAFMIDFLSVGARRRRRQTRALGNGPHRARCCQRADLQGKAAACDGNAGAATRSPRVGDSAALPPVRGATPPAGAERQPAARGGAGGVAAGLPPKPPMDEIEADTADAEDGLDLRELLLPNGSFPACRDRFSVSVSRAALSGWVKQPSPCCCAASLRYVAIFRSAELPRLR